MDRRLSLLLFLGLSVGGGLAVGLLTSPGEWYEALNKPAFNPPGWIFGPVWTALYALIGIAGWRAWQRDRGGRAMRLWWTQLILNFAWTPIFFWVHRIGLALAVVLLLLAVVLAFIGACWRQDRPSAWLFVPYAAWVAFASLLTASIYLMN